MDEDPPTCGSSRQSCIISINRPRGTNFFDRETSGAGGFAVEFAVTGGGVVTKGGRDICSGRLALLARLIRSDGVYVRQL